MVAHQVKPQFGKPTSHIVGLIQVPDALLLFYLPANAVSRGVNKRTDFSLFLYVYMCVSVYVCVYKTKFQNS